MCVAESWPTAFSLTLLQPVLDDKSAVRNRARTNRKSMYPATCPASIRSVAFLHTSQFFNLSLSLCLSLDVSASPHIRLCSVLLWKPQHLLYFKDVFVSFAVYPSDWAPRQRDAVWMLPSASREGQELALGVRFLQTRSLQGDDSWRNALLIPPNAGHMRVVWVASRGGEKK